MAGPLGDVVAIASRSGDCGRGVSSLGIPWLLGRVSPDNKQQFSTLSYLSQEGTAAARFGRCSHPIIYP